MMSTARALLDLLTEAQSALTDDALQAFAASIKRHASVAVFNVRLNPNNRNDDGTRDIELESMAMVKGQQGGGVGTHVMEKLCAFADAHHARIVLGLGQKGYQPVEGGVKTTSRSRLVSFYRQFGFVENRGRNKDYCLSIYTGMYRKAKP